MITEKQVEHVIIPMPHEHLAILLPNITIIFLTIILIVFYIRQSAAIKKRKINTKHELNDLHSTISLPNIISNPYQRSLSNRTKSLMTVQRMKLR